MSENERVKIKKEKNISAHELVWDEEERKDIESRILRLRDDQIGALAKILLDFDNKDIYAVVEDIRNNGIQSGHLPILMEEAQSKEDIKWWVEYFENQ